jgi:ABC-2 type transport system permease protein
MRNTLAIAKREFSSYFNSPIPFILVALFVGLASYLYFARLFIDLQADMRPFFELMPLLFVMLIPLLTMRLFAEEKKEGTLELLLTMPVKDWELVLGKYLSVLGILAVLLLVTLAVPMSVATLGDIDKGATTATYFGAFLMGGSYAAIGLMADAQPDRGRHPGRAAQPLPVRLRHAGAGGAAVAGADRLGHRHHHPLSEHRARGHRLA